MKPFPLRFEAFSMLPDPRQTLLDQQAELRARLAEHEGGDRLLHAQELLAGHDDRDRALEADREVDVALGEQERLALCEIEAALHRLDEGRYGRCADCGESIPSARLAVLPQALYCIDCERLREAGPHKAAHHTL